MDEKDLYEGILAHYGVPNQIAVAVEECSEVQHELCRLLRKDRPMDGYLLDHLAEEIADVRIAMEQMEMAFELERKVAFWRNQKLRRAAAKLEKDREEEVENR